jgi:hypothetical protein
VSYHLCQIGSLLKKAYEHAKQEMGKYYYYEQDGIVHRGRMVAHRSSGGGDRVTAGKDIGHDQALKQAQAASAEYIAGAFYTDVPTDEYRIFFWQAMWYLKLRGIPLTAFHVQAVETYYYYYSRWNGRMVRTSDSHGHGVQMGTRKLLLAEEALRYAGIPLFAPSERRYVDANYGIIRSDVTGKVKASYVHGKDGRLPVEPGNPLVSVEVWDTPSISREVQVVATIGGEIGKVSIKVGDPVYKDQTELLRLKNPWVSTERPLPCLVP